MVYRSSATVLMSAPSAIDASAAQANVQDVAIQSRILLGGDVTARLLEAFSSRDSAIDLRYLRHTLRVDAVSDTNLVEMVAEGTPAELNRFMAAIANRMEGHIRQTAVDARPGLGEFDGFHIRH